MRDDHAVRGVADGEAEEVEGDTEEQPQVRVRWRGTDWFAPTRTAV